MIPHLMTLPSSLPAPAVLAALPLPPWIDDHLQWWVAGLIVVLGLLVYGLKDVARFSGRRVWAISSVCFDESIRKRVLWITPLAILGVIIVSQFQKPIDEADTVRQMLKVCLFATGLVVTVTAIILACTNLPKEIENRVIYTVVTKPTTRLEIVLGKILGFARVSAAILIIMGLFTLGYLWFTAAALQRGIALRLADPASAAAVRPTLEYYRDTGLLTARSLLEPNTLQVVARPPEFIAPASAGADTADRWMIGGEGDVMVPFNITPDLLVAPGDATQTPGSAGVVLELRVGFEQLYRQGEEPANPALPVGVAAPEDVSPATRPDGARDVGPPQPASVSVVIVDRNEDTLVPPALIARGQTLVLTDPTGTQPLRLPIAADAMDRLDRWLGRVWVVVMPSSPWHEYRLTPNSVRLTVPSVTPGTPARTIEPGLPIDRWAFRGRQGRVGAQVRGGTPGGETPTQVASFRFRDAQVKPDSDGLVSFEFRCDIERSGVDDRDEEPTRMTAVVRNRETGRQSEPVSMLIEANRPVFFKVPGEFMQGGQFDVFVRCPTTGHYLSVQRTSLAVVRSNQSFVFNLTKSLAIMWMMSLLVIAVAIFCSTFLSWPIAVVLTIVMLLGRWGVMQLGDALLPGIGNQVATDLGFSDPAKSAVVSKSVEALARLLNASARVLPDISQFASIEDLERGVAIPSIKLREAVGVLGTFGLPIVVLAYVFLRNKEVAP